LQINKLQFQIQSKKLDLSTKLTLLL